MIIKTNNHPRPLYCLADLPKSAQAAFDYLEQGQEHDYRLFQYRGEWCDFYEFEDVSLYRNIPSSWHGVQTESYFSAVLVRYLEQDDEIIVGYAHW